jgi:hypothetical protein
VERDLQTKISFMNTFHLTARENDWVLTLDGRSKPLGTYRSKDRALEVAVDLVSERSGVLQILRRDGTVAEGRTKATGSGLRCFPVTLAAPPPQSEMPAPPVHHSRRRNKGRGAKRTREIERSAG